MQCPLVTQLSNLEAKEGWSCMVNVAKEPKGRKLCKVRNMAEFDSCISVRYICAPQPITCIFLFLNDFKVDGKV